jgi:hypothetical protein
VEIILFVIFLIAAWRSLSSSQPDDEEDFFFDVIIPEHYASGTDEE